MNFTEKCLGGEVPFNPKTDVADYGNFKEGFCSMKLIKKRVISGLRICFFSTIVLRQIKTRRFEKGSFESPPPPSEEKTVDVSESDIFESQSLLSAQEN